MNKTEYTIAAHDGHIIPGVMWAASGQKKPIASILILHGMSEHMGRYARLARDLVAAGYLVFSYDQRGHGHAISTSSDLGYFGPGVGWRAVVEDAATVAKYVKTLYMDIPLFVLGHSMGSFVAQNLAIVHPDQVDGLILSSSAAGTGLLGKVGYALACAEVWRLGPSVSSPLLQSMSFESFNKKMGATRTAYDWLSQDNIEVDAYIQDPLSGAPATTSLWKEFLQGILFVEKSKNRTRTPQNMPIYLIAGSRDPSNDFAAGARALGQAYLQAGVQDVYLKVYMGARHELFNETNRDEVTQDLLAWLADHLAIRVKASL